MGQTFHAKYQFAKIEKIAQHVEHYNREGYLSIGIYLPFNAIEKLEKCGSLWNWSSHWMVAKWR